MSDIKGGAHLGVAHNWIQWHARNGEHVTWGHHDLLQVELHVDELERLAQDIRDAVLREFKVRDTDYQYRYTVACDTGPAFQFADTIEEIWAKLYRARGRVMIKDATVTSDDTSTSWIFHGTPEEARAWCLAQQG